jgi:uncharacterized protein (DUF1697 family)
MAKLVALLHAVNVGGTGALSMEDLRRICADLGFADPRTYIASGNVVFGSGLAPATAGALLEAALLKHLGKSVRVAIRSGAEMRAVLEGNPWPQESGSKVMAFFVDEVPRDPAVGATSVSDEEMAAGPGVVYVRYPSGQGRSKLKLPAAKGGTARNMNTIARLADMAST